MSKEKKEYPVYISDSDSLSLMRDPYETIETVNGEKKFVTKTDPPIKFVNGQYKPKNENEADFMADHRHNGVLFKELPKVVEEVATGKGDPTTVDQKLISENEKLKAELEALKAEKESAEKKNEELNEAIDEAQGQTESDEPEENAEAELTVVEDVTSYNEAQDYLRENHDLKYKDVNSKDKVVARMEEFGLDFPNYE